MEYAYRHNLFNGTGIRTFAPLGTITRAMFVTVLGRMVGVDISKYQNKSTFSDVDNDAYYAPYVAWAVENGITTGTGNGLFSPDEPVNREQMAVFMVRLFEALGISLSETDETDLPKDFDSISDYAKEAVLKLWNGGMFQGDSKGRFNPKNNATRAECASFLMRIDELLVQIGYKKYVTEEKQEEKPVVIIGGGGTNPGQEPGEEPGEETYTVTFKDGSRVVDTLTAVKDQPLGTVPGADKTAKQNAIFVGWFKDPGLTEPFYYDYPVTEDLTVYAKYTELQSETLNITSFAQLDQGPDLSFEIVRSEDAGTLPEDAFTLIRKDGSDPIPLTWTVNGNVYTVSAVGGFKEGSSYELTLADGYSFKDKPETVRTASFSIAKEEVKNLEMSDGIIYIRDTDELDYVIGEKVYEVLVPSLVSTKNGTFVYEYADTLNVNDIICFYINTKPTDRDYMNFSYHDDPEVYVKVLGVSGDNTVTFGPLGDDEMAVLYKIPDNFPIIVPTLPTEDTGVVNINQLDVDTYIMIMGADGTLEKAKDRVNVGDFISLYVSPDSVTDEDSVYFGEVTGYNKDTGEISYKRTTKEAIESSMDLYVTPDITGDDLISPEEKALIEEQLYAQIKKSGFAEDAAFLLADMAAKTKGFRELDGIQVFFKDENGNPLSYEEIELLNIGKSFELSDDVELTVELITKGDRLHFKDGVQLAVGIDAEFETETEDEGKIVIHLSAAFTEEVALGVNVKGDLVWKKILFFIPVPIGVSVSSSIDIKNFSAVSFNINIYTVEKEEESTWEKVKGLLEDTQVGPILKQIEEVQNKIDQAKGTAEQLAGYYSDLEALWNSIPSDKTDKEEWKQLGETLGKTNITKDLLELMDLSLDTELEAGLYAQSIRELMEKYSEMLQTETDWVKLVDQKMFGAELCILGVAISTSVNFVVRADVNIAMGSSLEYEVGKRYIFWFKIGLFKPSAGTETMDLMDEHFAFQFYVMGKIGMKMGIAASIEVGIGSSKLASVGITAEMGPYIKLYGFFVYEYEKLRPANNYLAP
ncbi:MAG: hypothetical protein GX082_01880 [Clostridiaceae bacterium]|nr:hypothetical protein [Clostridiaceae bacterium]